MPRHRSHVTSIVFEHESPMSERTVHSPEEEDAQSRPVTPEPRQVHYEPTHNQVPWTPARTFRDPFAFDDGDVILRSSDRVEFKVHSLILRLASPTWTTLVQAHRGQDHISIPLRSTVLEALLRFIYPIEEKSHFNTLADVLEVYMSAIESEISCARPPIRVRIAELLSCEPNPLRAWAIAERYEMEDSIKAAARRFIQTDDDLLSPAVQELLNIPALRYNSLLTVRRDILRQARAAVLNVAWGCPSCSRSGPRWKAVYLTRVSGQNPFTPEITQDSIFELCCHLGGCAGCPGTFQSSEARTAREGLRTTLASILDSVDVN